MLQPGESLDGYRVIRLIGSGGFGEVWLCQSEALGDFRALKFIPAIDPGRIEKEFDALCRYRTAAGRLRSPSIMPIEHVNRRIDGLFYIMPLADGYGAADPLDPAWRPLTMAAVIERRREEPTWFTSEEIKGYVTPILQALQLLSDAGLVHRDVKPDNILFLNGSPCLGDISLLGEDSHNITRRGTPGYSAPSWFVESGGHPDMFGVATTLYSLLTGNPPDKMGRTAFRWPPQGENLLSAPEKKEWQRIHRIIRRAVDERPAERFQDFSIFSQSVETGIEVEGQKPGASKRGVFFVATGLVILLVVGWLFFQYRQGIMPKAGAESSRTAPGSPSASKPVSTATTSAESGNIPEMYRADMQRLDEAIKEDRKAINNQLDLVAKAVAPVLVGVKKLSADPSTPLPEVVKKLSEIKEEFEKALEKAGVPPPSASKVVRPLYQIQSKMESMAQTYEERAFFTIEVLPKVADRILRFSGELEELRASWNEQQFAISDALPIIGMTFGDNRLPDGRLDPNCKKIEKLVESIATTSKKINP